MKPQGRFRTVPKPNELGGGVLSDTVDEAAFRRNYSWLLRRLAKPGTQRAVAQMLGVSESTVSELKTGGALERVIRIISAVQGKLVDEETTCLDPIDKAFVNRILARTASSGSLFNGDTADFQDTAAGFGDSQRGGL
jgi:DNA-binding transcriptional regulator YdaS (Cro superfamily)